MIEVNNLTKRDIDKNFVKKILKRVLEGEGIEEEVELSIAFVGPSRMRNLNSQYRGKNRVTDVLSFPEKEILFEKFGKHNQKKVKGLGEIVLCPRRVLKNSKNFSRTFEKEMAFCLIHGLLHLLGYEHEKEEKEAKDMEKKQNFYLNKVKFS